VHVIVPFAAGGTTDLFARLLARHMQRTFNVPFVIENHGGAGGNIGAAIVAKAAPDGNTVLVGTASIFAINPFAYSSLPYDSERSFQPVSLIARVPNILVVHPRVPVTTVQQLSDYARANPNKLSYGSSGPGTSQHLAGALFAMRTGGAMTHVPYRSSGEIMSNLSGGHIDLAFDNIPLALPLVNSGAIRAIAVTTAGRSASAPNLPAIAETLPGFDAAAWHGVFVPAGTPRLIVDRLNAEIRRILELPEIAEQFFKIGAEPRPMTPEEFSSYIQAERGRWREVVKASGVKLD
jgi:tripartite-type tricarboxylate transporter receptor subunit TctC